MFSSASPTNEWFSKVCPASQSVALRRSGSSMIEFRHLSDDHPDLARSPMFRAASLTLGYALEQGNIGLTATKAFKRDFVHWAVEHFQ